MEQKTNSSPTIPKILLVEDSPELHLIVRAALADEFQVEVATNLAQAIQLMTTLPYDLYLIDWVLPDGEGIQLVGFVKSQKNPKPAVLLTSKDSIEDKIRGFEFGANDYITKPFHPAELRARVKALLKQHMSNQKINLTLGRLHIDLQKQHVYADHKVKLDLTPIEFRLLVFFLRHFEHVLSRQQLLSEIWPDNLNVSERTVDSHVSHLRKKVKPYGFDISPISGEGYRFSWLSTKLSAA